MFGSKVTARSANKKKKTLTFVKRVGKCVYYNYIAHKFTYISKYDIQNHWL